MREPREFEITRVGAQGDGVAETPDGPVFVPFTLAGERVRAEVEGSTGHLVEVLTRSSDRILPPCRHFTVCGGCALQHMSARAYLAWKKEQVVAAFRARSLDVAISDVVACSGTRRRAALSARLAGAGVLLGFHKASSHDLVDLEECCVLHPSIVAAFPMLRPLVAPLLSRRGETRVIVTWTLGGLDVALGDVSVELTPRLRALVAGAAASAAIARVSVDEDPVYEGLTPALRFGGVEVVPPPGTFLQAVAEMEVVMGDLVLAGAGKSRSIADLFCGIGAFTLRLAERARVFAADGDKRAIGALNAALKRARGLKPVEALRRDLFREPLSATELRDFDCVVFDPPRAGADAQARMLARSRVNTVVAVSCNPATLARDARTLIDGGYKLEAVTPVDQFLYSPHIEVVAVFRRQG
ncbi:MAG TPA: class I SAM-dependent RNA methyltransferase [Hyphomicrobium sp.]|nr:class I SAM-dependent RNA methyltransferase [Hyphomicrobium sp.]